MNLTKEQYFALTPEQRTSINQNMNLHDLGTIISEALNAHDNNDSESVWEMLLSAHSMIYPFSSYIAPKDELIARSEAADRSTDKSVNSDDTTRDQELDAITEEYMKRMARLSDTQKLNKMREITKKTRGKNQNLIMLTLILMILKAK